jgi:plasmid maintenance system antidote protein VapI
MKSKIEILKGLHPGLFLKRELDIRNIESCQFAESIGENPQTLSDIIQGRIPMNISLSLSIENVLDLEEGFLMTLQLFYDIAKEKKRLSKFNRPDLTKFRAVLFWDTDLESIDFNIHSEYVINRVFQRGTSEELEEIVRFYGHDKVLKVINLNSQSPFNNKVKENLKIYLGYDS